MDACNLQLDHGGAPQVGFPAMRRAIPLFFALALVAAGCDRDRGRDAAQDRALASRALKGALAYPGSSMVSVSAVGDAAHIDLSPPPAGHAVATLDPHALPFNLLEVHQHAPDASSDATL